MSDKIKVRSLVFSKYVITKFGVVINTHTNKVLKSYRGNDGRLRTTLRNGTNRLILSIPRTVYRSFIGKLRINDIIVYKDGNHDNVHYSNLDRVVSKNTFRLGHSGYNKKPSVQRKLTEDDVRLIRSGTLTLDELSKVLPVTKSSIIQVIKRVTYKEVI